MDIQRVQPGLSGARPITGARLDRIAADPAGRDAGVPNPAEAERGLSRIKGPQVTSEPGLQSVLSDEETQALSQVFAAFRSAAQNSRLGTYTGRGSVPPLPPLGGGRPGQLIDVVG
ncbi:MAG: hypothetical protein HYW07_18180 [Candidatus Latescibacteria bacterium]|nr:hypothetical protein [Candidatus Latescibacterota bacterium]